MAVFLRAHYGYASGEILQYVIETFDGEPLIANEDELRPE